MDYQDPIHDNELSSSFTDRPMTNLPRNLPLGCLASAVTIFTGFVGFTFCMLAWHPDTLEQVEEVKQWEKFTILCGAATLALWGILLTRGILGNGKEQAETLKSVAQAIVPSRPAIPTDNKDILVRASEPFSAPSEELLRPARADSSIAPNELLRASDEEN